MNQSQKYQLEDLIFDLTEIPVSDILAHVDFTKKEICKIEDQLPAKFEYPLDAKWNALLKTALQNKRQSDTDTLCLAVNGIEWQYKGKTILSPLILVPASYKINKVKQEVQLFPDFESMIFNPFVRNELKRSYELILEMNEITDISDSELFYQVLEDNGFQFKKMTFNAFGNFHHHRFEIVKDLEALTKVELNSLVQEMLGNPVSEKSESLHLTKQNIVPADKDQKAVFAKVETGNLVIQGPPGTGKSQVLTNLLAKFLEKGNMSLVVSEKKTALEVLVKKLKEHRLEIFTFIVHNQTKPSEFIDKLRDTWSKLEVSQDHPPSSLLLSEQHLDQLQLTLHRLGSKKLIGGISFSEFQELLRNYDLKDTAYFSDVPSVSGWLEQKEILQEITETIPSFESIQRFNQSGLSESGKMDQVLGKLKKTFAEFTEKMDFQTFGELELRIKQIVHCQILENESYKKYAHLFSSKKDRKKFEKLRLAFIQQTKRIESLGNEAQTWKSQPSMSQVESWKLQLSASWWKKRKAEKQISALLTSATILPAIAIENWIHYIQAETDLQKTKLEFLQLGIERPEIEIESIHYILNQIDKQDQNQLSEVAKFSAALRKELTQSGNSLQNAYRELKNVIIYDIDDNLLQIIGEAENNLPQILPVQKQLQQLSPDLYRLIQKTNSTAEIEKIILKSNWTKFASNFPELAKFNGEMLKSRIQAVIDLEKEEHELFGKTLAYNQYQKFNVYHEILRTSSSRLKPDEKILKAALRAGKSILVKEFSKTRQHKTIRELLSGEAKLWIEILVPIWLSTPQKVASVFPMEQGLFDWVIFDEASQIPLSNALGSLQRSRRAVVAGDEKQMSPSSYFSSVTSQTDLLHQSSYYWNKSPLKHHYRSTQPELIAFSNQYFYNNELIAYPSADQSENPIKYHFIENGVFDERQNINEAKAIAKQISTQLQSTGSIGIVAFSEQQLNCIWKQLDSRIQDKLNESIEKGTAFFKSLEQVQGDECDHLLISFGYGKNPEGEFHLRFGPLNQKNGPKRLNVLFSRAKMSIDLFTSVKSYDLSVSVNESINLLRLFMFKAEQKQQKNEIIFPFGLKPEIKGSALLFSNMATHLPDAEELVNLHTVLTSRGWQMTY